LEAKNAVLQADLQLAREIQEALLPREYPTFTGFGVSGQNALSFAHYYLPAAAVGGGFFGILALFKTRQFCLRCRKVILIARALSPRLSAPCLKNFDR
jgi:sigma-B regulation protein RsbU (phosphoserine phosphatase)